MADRYLAILGANELACPAIERLTRLGYQTLAIDRNPHPKAYNSASKVITCNFFEIDELRKVLRPYILSGIMPINDFGVENASIIAEERGLYGNSRQAALNVKEKYLMKKCWINDGLPTPEFEFNELNNFKIDSVNWNHFPCIVKPSFVGGGSRGVFLINKKEDLLDIINKYSAFKTNRHIIIEQYIQGTEHTIEVLIWKGNTHLMSISDKKNYKGSATIVQDLFFPGPKGNRFREHLETLLDKAIKSLGLEYGCAHFEVIIDKDDKIWLIEVGGRPGGGLNFHPISILSTGYDYPMEYASILTKGSPLLKKQKTTFNLYWHFFEGYQGVLERIEGWDEVLSHPDVVECGLLVKTGDRRNKEFENDLERPGHVLFKYYSFDDLKNKLYFFDSTVKFLVKD